MHPIIYNREGFITKLAILQQIYNNDKLACQKALNRDTIVVEQYGGFKKKYPQYQIKNEYVKLTRGFITNTLAPLDVHKIIDKNPLSTSTSTSTPTHTHTLQIQLYDNQTIILNHLIATYFNPTSRQQGRAGCVLNFRAGMGKTFIAGALIAHLNVPTLYVVQTDALQTQTTDELLFALTAKTHAKTTETKPSKRNKTPAVVEAYTRKHFLANVFAPVVVIIDKSLVILPPEHLARYDLIIYDEAHTMSSPQNNAFLWRAQFPYQLGLTGTPNDRTDKLDPLYHNLIGGVVSAEDIEGFSYENVKFDIHVEIIKYKGAPEHTQNLTHPATGKMFCSFMYKQFMADPARNGLIVRKAEEIYNWRSKTGQRHNLFIFLAERDSLTELKATLTTKFATDTIETPELINDAHATTNPVEAFMGGTTAEQLINVKTRARIVLATYDYAGTGISIDRMTAIIFATPRKAKMKQIIARILRRTGDLTIPRVVVDIVDWETGLKKQVYSRKEAYKFYDCNITTTTATTATN